ncbi:hypothetical protein [Paenibacillus jilunlii]|uniref:Uncharacterized protein n=1 Tax=Paenibacillus jilunlii TaxID=682956 RepID=A0A1G9X7J3_9BACL|nr:hypothetical protein [Paenibacillus jilunlii]KWX73598.1 hypothetical protein AML91_18185 [Paenibacillus jilunlii]SDM92456.1 hypothetical protein SAMN05216191_12138 [Paenibacillus jilunlii]
MNERILHLFQKINSLLWVYDIRKTEPLLKEAKALLAEMKDPFLQKIFDQYKDTYDELNIKEMQVELDSMYNNANIESSNIFYSNANFSELLIIKNEFEADIRIVTSSEFLWRFKEHHQEISVVDRESQNSIHAEKSEESDSGVVYELVFPNHVEQFGAITFTSSGITEGRFYAKHLSKSDGSHHSVTCKLFIELASKVYGVSND